MTGTAGLFFVLGSLDAHAGCSVTAAQNASFGTVTSFALRTAVQSTSTTSSGFVCSGAVSSVLLVGDQINMTRSSANRGALVSSAGGAIPYQVYGDENAVTPINVGESVNWAAGQLFSRLRIFTGPSKALPLYFRIAPGANVAAGTYTDTVSLNWNWNYCSGSAVQTVCQGRDRGSGVSTFTVTLTVTNDCTIVAPDINFGSAPTVKSFSAATGSVSLTCTKGLVYTVGLSGGSFPAQNSRRQMASGGSRLQYDLFNGGSSTVWGQSTNRVNSAGAADGLSAQQFPLVAKIYTDQTTPPVGTYTDSVVVDVRY